MPIQAKSRSAPRPKEESASDKRYHHGDLATALLAAAETVLTREGLDGLTLRAVAREAGVSHTAPQHHFGDLAGLLSELAAIGFARFRDTMLGAAEHAADPAARALALGKGYLDFARGNPGLFLLMFRSERLDMGRPALTEAADAAFAVLARSRGVEAGADRMSLPQAAGVTGAWAFVHGLAFLAIDGRLNAVLASTDGEVTEDALLDAILRGMLARTGAPGTAA